MQVTGFRDVSKPGDVQRLVKWEESWIPVGDGYEARTLHPTIWEWTYLDVSNPRRIEYSGPEFKWVTTAISVLQDIHLGVSVHTVWPKEVSAETEFVRRDRIRTIRLACHVDPVKGEVEPYWFGEWDGLKRATAPQVLERLNASEDQQLAAA